MLTVPGGADSGPMTSLGDAGVDREGDVLLGVVPAAAARSRRVDPLGSGSSSPAASSRSRTGRSRPGWACRRACRSSASVRPGRHGAVVAVHLSSPGAHGGILVGAELDRVRHAARSRRADEVVRPDLRAGIAVVDASGARAATRGPRTRAASASRRAREGASGSRRGAKVADMSDGARGLLGHCQDDELGRRTPASRRPRTRRWPRSSRARRTACPRPRQRGSVRAPGCPTAPAPGSARGSTP